MQQKNHTRADLEATSLGRADLEASSLGRADPEAPPLGRADLEATPLGRFLLEEVPWRVREVHDHAALSEDEVAELAQQLLNVCLDYDAIDQCIADYLSKK